MVECVTVDRHKENIYNLQTTHLPTNQDSSIFKNVKAGLYNSLEISSSPYSQPQDPIVSYIEHYRNIYASPDNFIKRRVDYGRMKVFDEKYRKESERKNSFIIFPEHLEHLINPLAKSGFYHVATEEELDKVKCIFCQGTLRSWKKADVPDKEHKKSFPTCPFILNLNVGNEPLKEEPKKFSEVDPDLKDYSGVVSYNVIKSDSISNFELPINFNDDCNWRESTFRDKWVHLKYLALEGLFVQETGDNDYIVCYHCQKSTELLSGVKRLPIKIFHKNSCSLITEFSQENILQMKSIETTKSNNKSRTCKIEYSITDEEIEARLDSRLANKIASVVDQKKNIKLLIAQKLKRTGKDYDSLVDLFYDLKMYEMKEDESDTSCDNDEDPYAYAMRDHVCVVCLDNPAQVVYLPCGHFKTCRTCSNALKSCPVCRKLIERRVYDIQFHLN